MRGEGIIEDTLTLMKSREPSIQETRELEKKLSIMDEPDLEELETQVKKLKNIEEINIGVKEDKRTRAYKDKKKLEDEIAKNRAMVEERESIKRKIIRRKPKIKEYNINKEKLKHDLANVLKNKIMGKVITKKRIQEKQEALDKKKQKLYRAYGRKITEFMEPYVSMRQMMFLQKQKYEGEGKFNNMTDREKKEITRDGKFFELLLDGPLKYAIYAITGDQGTITNNDTNERIRKDLRIYAVFDLSQKTADIECKCFVCNAYNRSSTGEIVLQKTKIEGNIGFKPYYIVVDGEVKLYNVWNERESKWVNKDFYKDTYVVFLLTDGIYKFNIIDYDGFEIGNEATVGGVEDLFILKSKISYVKKDFEGTKQEVVVLDNSKLIKIY